MKLPYVAEIAASALLLSVMLIPDSGGIVPSLTANGDGGSRIAGAWTSYTPTRFGATSVEFFENGKCEFRRSADEALPCQWQGTRDGRTTILQTTAMGGTEVHYAAVAGDTMVVKAPGSETPYVRVDSREAFERQRLAGKGLTFRP